jgi:peroxiredoxin
MLKQTLLTTLLAVSFTAQAAPALNQPAPDFSLTDSQGKTVKLADYKGKTVVLEWFNPNCPFVKKHYVSQNMQGLQKSLTAKNVVWLNISSTIPGHEDYYDPAALNNKTKEWGAAASSYLLDPDGKVGRSYEAKTTPHMYIIDGKGSLVYAGGIDDKRSSNAADIPAAKNFVKAAFDDMQAGKPIAVASSTPYGCSVKYTK